MKYFLPITDIASQTVEDPVLAENILTDDAKPGVYSFAATADLNTLERALITRNNGKFDNDMEHALPSPIAHIEALRSVLRAPVNPEDPLFLAWQGVLAAFALQKKIRLQFRIREIDIKGAPLRDVFYEGLDKCGMVRTGIDGGMAFEHIFVLELSYTDANGQPAWEHLALVSREFIFCPFKNVSSQALRKIPWFSEGKWVSLASRVHGQALIKPQNKDVLISWLNGIREEVSEEAKNGIEEILNSLGVRGQTPVTFRTLGGDFFVVDSMVLSEEASTNITDVPGYSVELISEESFFSTRIVETIGEQIGDLYWEQNENGYCTGTGTEGKRPTLTLLPISKEGIEFLQKPEVRLTSVRMNKRDGGIQAHMEVTIDGKENFYGKQYTEETILKIGNFPVLSLWPNQRFTNEGAEAWHNYYLAAARNEGIKSADKMFKFLTFDQLDGRGTIEADNCEEKHKINFAGKNCKISRFKEFPEYVHYCCGGVDCGCVYIKKPEPIPLNAGTVAEAAIDYGTSNTVCVLAVNGRKVPVNNFFGKEDVRDLSKYEQKLEEDYKELHKALWLSTDNTPMTKIKTVVMRYNVDDKGERALSETDGIVDGRMLVVDKNVLGSLYSTKTHSFISAVYTNTKFAGIYADDQQARADAGAACLAEQELVLRCALEAMKQRAGRLTLRFSYPDQRLKANLSKYWMRSTEYAQNATFEGFIPSYQEMMEAEAAARFYINRMPDGFGAYSGTAPAGDFAVVDIGGGTTDISLWVASGNGVEAKKLDSLRYAGNELISASLAGGYRITKGANFEQLLTTKKLDSGLKDAINTASVEGDLCTVMNSVVSDLNMGVFNDPDMLLQSGIGKAIFYPKQLIRARLCLVFSYLTKQIKENYDFSGYTANDRFHIYFAGGGAQALELAKAMKDDMDQFSLYLRTKMSDELKENNVNVTNVNVTPHTFILHVPTNTDKLEVVHGMLFRRDVNGRNVNVYIPDKVVPEALPAPMAEAEDSSERPTSTSCKEAYMTLIKTWMESKTLLKWENNEQLYELMEEKYKAENWGNAIRETTDVDVAAIKMAELILKQLSEL